MIKTKVSFLKHVAFFLAMVAGPVTGAYAWSFKPPKTGIPIIDNNRDFIGGAAAGSVVVGSAGVFAGAWWADHKQAQDKIDELRSKNNQLAADLAQAKLDKEIQRAELEERIKGQVETNACLKHNGDAYRLIIDVISEAKNTFNSCLEAATSDEFAQSCLNNYDDRVSTMLNVALAIVRCN